MIDARELADRLGISTARVRQLAKQGRISGTVGILAGAWMFNNNAHVKEAPRTRRLRLRKERQSSK